MKKLALTQKMSIKDLSELINMIINFESKKNSINIDLNIITTKKIIIKHFLNKLLLNTDNISLSNKIKIYNYKRGGFLLSKNNKRIGIIKINIKTIKNDTVLKNTNNNLFRIWNTCAHEVRHAYQHKNLDIENKNIIDLGPYQNTIERMLVKNTDPSFYTEYYDYLFFERDAVNYGFKEARKYVDGFDEDYVRIYETINDIYMTSLPEQYMIKKAFDDYVFNDIKPLLHINNGIFNANVLNLEYITNGFNVRRKSIYELFNTLNYKDFNNSKPNVTKKLLYQLIWDNLIITKPTNDEINLLTDEQKQIVLDVLKLKNYQITKNNDYSLELIELAKRFSFFKSNEKNMNIKKNVLNIAKNNLEKNKQPNFEFKKLINHYEEVILNSEIKVRN